MLLFRKYIKKHLTEILKIAYAKVYLNTFLQ